MIRGAGRLSESGPVSASAWRGWLGLRLAPAASGRTTVVGCRHHGPLQVQRAFYPEADGACHLYVLHPPGGVVGGDRLEVEVSVEQGAGGLITTPSASRFYRSAGPLATQRQQLRIAAGAALEWLPQETIVFDGARAASLTRVDLEADARFLGWEILCLGRPAAAEPFVRGLFQQDMQLWRAGLPLYLEQGRYRADDELLHAAWGLAGQPVVATLLATLDEPGLIDAIRNDWGEPVAPELFGVTQLEDVLVCRYRGPSTARARALFIRAWRLLRPPLLGKPPCPPRVWAT